MVWSLQNDRPAARRRCQSVQGTCYHCEAQCRRQPGDRRKVRHPRHPDSDALQRRQGCRHQGRCHVQVPAHRFPGRIAVIQNTHNDLHWSLLIAGATSGHATHSKPTSTLSSLHMHLNELKALHVSQLLEMAASLEIDNASRLRKQELMFAIMKKRAKQGEQIFGDGVLEVLPDGFGFLRSPE